MALITFATPGPLGYMVGEADTGPPTLAMHTFPIPKERYKRFFPEGVALVFHGFTPEFDDLPNGVKHRSRIHWWRAGRASQSDDVPVLLGENDVPDTALGAVLTVTNGVIEHPRRGKVLDSISLRIVLELAGRLGIETRERTDWPLGRKSDGVSELLLAGSAFGIAGVREFVWLSGGGEVYPWPGPVFTKLAAAWSQMVGVDIVKQFTE